MTRRPRRPRLLVGALLAAAAIWAADRMIGSGQPPAATAGPSSPDTSAASVVWGDVAGLIDHLTNRNYTSVDGELSTLGRDIFVPTPLVDTTFNQIAARRAAELATEAEDQTPPEPGFDTRHGLDAVIMGTQPRAVVDGRLLPLGTELDGHRLAEISRDRAVFQNVDTRELVVLELRQRPKTP